MKTILNLFKTLGIEKREEFLRELSVALKMLVAYSCEDVLDFDARLLATEIGTCFPTVEVEEITEVLKAHFARDKNRGK